MPEETKLKPCPVPWCASIKLSIINSADFGDAGGFYGYCQECGCCGPEMLTEAEAITAWNTRPVSELERLAREVVRTDKEYRSDATCWNLTEKLNAFDALAAYLAEPKQERKSE